MELGDWGVIVLVAEALVFGEVWDIGDFWRQWVILGRVCVRVWGR